jgi:hypothetical protein
VPGGGSRVGFGGTSPPIGPIESDASASSARSGSCISDGTCPSPTGHPGAGGRSWIGGRLNVVFMCLPTRPSERVVVDRADVGDQSPQGNGGGLRRSGGEALVSVVQAAYLGSRHDLAHDRRVRTLSLYAQRTSARSSPPATTWARLNSPARLIEPAYRDSPPLSNMTRQALATLLMNSNGGRDAGPSHALPHKPAPVPSGHGSPWRHSFRLQRRLRPPSVQSFPFSNS